MCIPYGPNEKERKASGSDFVAILCDPMHFNLGLDVTNTA